MYLYEMSRIGKSMETESRPVVVRDYGEKGMGVTDNGYWISLWGDENVLELDGNNGYTALLIY